ncbi:hypothetical protein Taro_022377, partial [Colocasia esculenta]|nr:hypothetical protein [Colocasia esculenta]
ASRKKLLEALEAVLRRGSRRRGGAGFWAETSCGAPEAADDGDGLGGACACRGGALARCRAAASRRPDLCAGRVKRICTAADLGGRSFAEELCWVVLGLRRLRCGAVPGAGPSDAGGGLLGYWPRRLGGPGVLDGALEGGGAAMAGRPAMGALSGWGAVHGTGPSRWSCCLGRWLWSGRWWSDGVCDGSGSHVRPMLCAVNQMTVCDAELLAGAAGVRGRTADVAILVSCEGGIQEAERSCAMEPERL